jgi:hypothetical protein
LGGFVLAGREIGEIGHGGMVFAAWWNVVVRAGIFCGWLFSWGFFHRGLWCRWVL